MAGITPIPTTRVSDFFIRQRLIGQVQRDQLDLFRLQTQVSTGRRIVLPSEDAPAALRAMNLQRVLQRKAQVETNLTGSASVLSAADASLANVSSLLNDVRAAALGVADTITSDESRQSVVSLVDATLKSLVHAANANYKGRYLFAGSRTDTLPFEYRGSFVEYRGNEKVLRNYVDLEQLFATNVPGAEVFGGISGEVRGRVDLDPQLTAQTLLSTINGGEGLGPNAAIAVSVSSGGPTSTSVVDLSSAVTIGDVIRLIEAHPPAGGANITVDIVGNGLTVRTDTGTIRIEEVASGRTARELGIFTPAGAAPASQVVGTDLDPAVAKTTALDALLGRKATGRIQFAGANNDLRLTANQNGASFNAVDIVFVSDAAAGAEYADPYDALTNTLTVHIQSGVSSAAQVAAAINAEGTFTASPDDRDALAADQVGTGVVTAGAYSDVTSDGAGEPLDTSSGLILTNGGQSVTLDISGAETVEDLLNLIQGAGVGLVAQINASRTGIDVRSVLSGADFTIGENGGTTATQLGIRTFNEDSRLADFNRGVGVPTNDLLGALDLAQLDAMEIVARDGTTLSIDLSSATSLQDVVDLINAAPGNFSGSTAVTASLSANGNGIALVDSSTNVTGQLVVRTVPGNSASEYLGFVSAGTMQTVSTAVDSGGNHVLTGNDVVKNDLRIEASDGSAFWVDLTGATTVQHVLDLINDAAGAAGVALTARLATTGNGIELVDATGGGGTLRLEAVGGSQAAEYLGFLPNAPVLTDGMGNQLLASADRNSLEVDSVFNSLIRLRDALVEGNTAEIGRAIDRLDADLKRVNFARAEIGSRLQSLDVIRTRLEDESVQLQTALSTDLDVDLVEAISQLTARQYALQASLQTAANILNLSLLDYL